MDVFFHWNESNGKKVLSIPFFKKKLPKIRELPDLDEILSTYSLMNELYTEQIISLENIFVEIVGGGSYHTTIHRDYF